MISHGANSPRSDRSPFRLEFDWTGTADPTAYLTVPEAIRYMGSLLPGGWPALMAHNRRTALAARDRLRGRARRAAARAGLDDRLARRAARARRASGRPPVDGERDPLQTALFDRFGIELPVFTWPALACRILRVSAQLYNTAADYERLAEALGALRATRRRRRPAAAPSVTR